MVDDATDTSPDSVTDELFHRAERVPFVYWRELTGPWMAVLATGAVAGLAFITGLSTLSRGPLPPEGPLAGVVPGLSGAISFYPVFLSFLLVGLATGLHRRLRVAWYGTVVALGLLALFPLVTGGVTSVPLLFLIAMTLPLVVRNRDAFDQPLNLGPFQMAALAVFFGVQIYGTVGAYAMRSQYTGIETWTDAFYYIVVTGTTVGYGDATPLTQTTKLFTLSVILIGTGAFGAVFGSLLVPAIESRITSAFGTMTASELTLFDDHVLILGHGPLVEPLLDEIAPATDVVVITPDPDEVTELQDREIDLLTDDPTDEEVLLTAGIDSASGVVVAMDDDPRSTLALIAARRAAPDVKLVVAANDPRNVENLEAAGADEVVSPAVIGGRLLGRSVLGESSPLLDEEAGRSNDDTSDQ